MTTDTAPVFDALAGIPELADIDPAAAAVTRLGGLTNLVYRLQAGDRDLCIRLPGQGTEEYIDREVEAHNAVAAARAGVSPAVVHADAATGVMVTEFLDGTVTMTPDLFAARDGSAGRAGAAFRQLHDSGETFRFRFELFSMIDDYLNILAGKSVDFPDGYHDVLAEAEAVREALNAHDRPLAPCHCDPLCENFLDTGERMWIVDWEYSGMNDPMWDLGDLSVEGGFSPANDEAMLNAYFGGAPGDGDVGRVVIYKAMCDLLWTLWGLIQLANDNPAEDFDAYAQTRFARCKTLMASTDFPNHLAAVRKG